ncbi:MAG: hypothetical protein KDI67_02515, partial [Gammaproteobacteria bacterium]|nr:hypothetical protein [Gammaproteobacteria bacterium]
MIAVTTIAPHLTGLSVETTPRRAPCAVGALALQRRRIADLKLSTDSASPGADGFSARRDIHRYGSIENRDRIDWMQVGRATYAFATHR